MVFVRTRENQNGAILHYKSKSIQVGMSRWRDLLSQVRIFIRFRGKLWAEELFFFKGRVRLGLINEISLRCTRAFSTFSKRIPSAQFEPVKSTVFFFRRPHGAINQKIIRSIFHANLSFLPDKYFQYCISGIFIHPVAPFNFDSFDQYDLPNAKKRACGKFWLLFYIYFLSTFERYWYDETHLP